MPTQNDILAGFDPTGQVTITAAQLLSLVNSAVLNVDKGMCVISADVAGVPQVPDARNGNGNTQWQRYLWIRVQAANATCYIWSPGSALDATFLYWIPAGLSIADLSITGSKIAPATITSDKIVSVDWGQISNIPSSGFIPGGAAGGDLTGIYPNPSILAGRVTAAKLANEAVTNINISGSVVGPPAVDIQKNVIVAGVFTAKQNVRVNDGATGLIAETKLITQIAEPTNTENDKLVKVASDHLSFGYIPYQGNLAPGRVLQVVETFDNTRQSGTGGVALTNVTTQPTTGFGTVATGLVAAVTPHNVTSSLLIEVIAWMAGVNAGAAYDVWLALFDGVAANALAGVYSQVPTASPFDAILPVTLRYSYNPGSTTPLNFAVRFGGFNITGGIFPYLNTTNANGGSGGAALLGGVMKSSIRVIEYI